MKQLVYAVLGFVVGIVFGGWVAGLQAERELARVAADEGSEPCPQDTEPPWMVELRRMAKEPGSAQTPQEESSVARAESPDPVGEELSSAAQEPQREEEASDQQARALQGAMQAVDLRRVQARAHLVERAQLSDDQLAEIDAELAWMNDELYDLLLEAGDLVEQGEGSRRELMILGADALDVLIEAEDRIEVTLEPWQLEALEEDALNPFRFLEPRIVRPLERVSP